MFKNKLYIFIFFFLIFSLLPLASASSFGYNNPNLPMLTASIRTGNTYINNTSNNYTTGQNQTPWLSNINGAGYNLNTTGNLTGSYIFGNGSFLTGIASGGTPSGSDTQVQFNDGGAFGGDAGLTYAKATDTLSVTGGVKTAKVYPAADSTTAFQINKADGITNILNVDTTNSRVGIGTTAPTAPFQVYGTTAQPGVVITREVNTANGGAFNFQKSRGVGVKTTAADQLGTFYFSLLNAGGAWVNVGLLRGIAGSNVAGAESGSMSFQTMAAGAVADRLFINTVGNIGIGLTTPTAFLHLKAGTATAGTAPLKFTNGTNLTTAEAGAMEYDGTDYFLTNSTPIRNYVATSSVKGMTNTTGFWMCKDSLCVTTCQVQIQNGLITGCT